MIIPFEEKKPTIADDVFIAPDAWVIGDVEIDSLSSVFFGAVLRGDIMPIRIGKNSNIQEHSVLHTSIRRSSLIVGNDVTIGHRSILHGCRINDRVLVGMGSIILDDAEIGEESIIGAGALVTEGKIIPPRSLLMGVPAKIVRSVSDQEVEYIKDSVAHYVSTGASYRNYRNC